MRRIIGTAIGLAIIPTLLMIGYVTSRHPQGFVWFMVSAVCVFFGYVGYTMADIRGAPVMADKVRVLPAPLPWRAYVQALCSRD